MPRAKKATAVIENAQATELPNELKQQLDNLPVNETFLKLTDNLSNALEEASVELKRIDERADLAINVVTQAIRTRAAVEKGRVLLDIKEKYSSVPEFEGTFTNWMKLEGIPANNAYRWMNAAQVVADSSVLVDEEALMGLSVRALDATHKLPADEKLNIIERVESGEQVTQKEVEELAKKPEVKLSKAQELLLQARAKRDAAAKEWEEAKADPEISYTSTEYNNARKRAEYAEERVESLEQEAADLRAMIKDQKAQAQAEAKARQIAEAELDALKFDDEAARQQRVKRIQSTLTIQIPQVLSDIQKYLAERDHYEEAYQEALNTLIKDLKSYLQEHDV